MRIMHFVLISNLEIKNGYAYSDRRLKLCPCDRVEKVSSFQKCEIQSNCLWEETQRGSSNILDFRKTLFSRTWNPKILNMRHYQTLLVFILICSWVIKIMNGNDSEQTVPHGREQLLDAGWKIWESVWPPHQNWSQTTTLGTRVHTWGDLRKTCTFYLCVITFHFHNWLKEQFTSWKMRIDSFMSDLE